MEKLTIKARDAADLIGCSLPTMYKIMEQPDFDCAFRLGRNRYIMADGFYKWLERQTKANSQERK